MFRKKKEKQKEQNKLLPCNADQFFSNLVAFTRACKTLDVLVRGEIQ